MATDSIELYSGKCCQRLSRVIFDRIFFFLASNEDYYKISDEFEIRPDPPSDCDLAVLESLKKIHIYLLLGKCCLPVYFASFYRIFFIIAGNQDRHKGSDVLIIRPDLTTDCGVSCH